MRVDFSLERGDRIDEVPVVWRVDEPLHAAQLARRFADDWAAWYGPALKPHTDAIGALLTAQARGDRRAADERPAVTGDRDGRLLAVALPLWWAVPVVRRQSRAFGVSLPLAESPAELLALVRAHLPLAWRWASRGVAVRIEFDTRMVWGALALPGQPMAEWQRCRVRADAVASTRELQVLDRGRPRADTLRPDDTRPRIERQLRGGVGLMVVVPTLTLERAMPSWRGRARRRWADTLRRLGLPSRDDRDPAFAQRLADDEAWWARALPAARLSPAEQAEAARRGALLQPASRAALRAGDPHQHVVVVPDAFGSVRHGFQNGVTAEPRDGAPLWPGLPVLDEVCSWRFEHDGFLPIERNVDDLADAISRAIVAPGQGGRIVLLAHGRGGNVVRFGLARLRQRFAARGWAFDAITLGSPHLGTTAYRQVDRLTPALPAGLRDIEPDRVAQLAGGQPARLPSGLWLFGADWGLAADEDPDADRWAWVVEGLAGGDSGGDGRVPRASALAGRVPDDPATPSDGVHAFDASPAFHDRYLANPATRDKLRQLIAHLLGRDGSWS